MKSIKVFVCQINGEAICLSISQVKRCIVKSAASGSHLIHGHKLIVLCTILHQCIVGLCVGGKQPRDLIGQALGGLGHNLEIHNGSKRLDCACVAFAIGVGRGQWGRLFLGLTLVEAKSLFC